MWSLDVSQWTNSTLNGTLNVRLLYVDGLRLARTRAAQDQVTWVGLG
jgi:hypothetical protein